MSLSFTKSVPVRAQIAALLAALAGMGVQIAAGVKYGPVPPGVVILAATALLLALVPWPGVRLLGLLVPAFILIGGFVSTTGRTNISHPAHACPFAGTLIQFIGLAAAVAAALVAIAEWRTSRTHPEPRRGRTPQAPARSR